MYEEFPLAKTRNTARINLQKLKIEYLIVDYKKTEIIKIIKQRQCIDWIRIRCKIIKFVTVMMERSKFENKLMNLKINVDSYGRELQSIEIEVYKVLNYIYSLSLFLFLICVTSNSSTFVAANTT